MILSWISCEKSTFVAIYLTRTRVRKSQFRQNTRSCMKFSLHRDVLYVVRLIWGQVSSLRYTVLSLFVIKTLFCWIFACWTSGSLIKPATATASASCIATYLCVCTFTRTLSCQLCLAMQAMHASNGLVCPLPRAQHVAIIAGRSCVPRPNSTATCWEHVCARSIFTGANFVVSKENSPSILSNSIMVFFCWEA